MSFLKKGAAEGESPLPAYSPAGLVCFPRVALFGNGAQFGGKLHLELLKHLRPIAYKYCEGQMKRTLERELKVPEITVGEAS